jgi:hypothetical protein
MKYMQQARWIAGAVPRSTSAFEYRKKRGEELQEIEEAALGMCAPHDILPEIQDGDSALNEDFTLLACGNRHIISVEVHYYYRQPDLTWRGSLTQAYNLLAATHGQKDKRFGRGWREHNVHGRCPGRADTTRTPMVTCFLSTYFRW